jgi:hypothetical protein
MTNDRRAGGMVTPVVVVGVTMFRPRLAPNMVTQAAA